MSENKHNPRPLEYYSRDKGPKRTLTLDLIDGKRYIKKRDLEKYYFQDMWNITDFQYHFGLGHRIVRASLYKWFTPDEIDRSHRDKIAKKQRGDNNSNRCNWYIPSKLIPLEKLRKAVETSSTKREVKERLRVTNYELSFLQQYYNFRLPKNNKLLDHSLQYRLSTYQVDILVRLLKDFHLEEVFFKDTLLGIRELDALAWELKHINRSLKRAFRGELNNDPRGGFPSNSLEYFFYKGFIKYYSPVIPQYYIKSLNIHVDFLLPHNTILELDGQLHKPKRDKIRDRDLSSLGYRVIRIDLKTCGLNRFYKLKDIRKCIKKYVLPELPQ